MSADGAPGRRAWLSDWAIDHPIGTSLIMLGVVILGGVALNRLGVDLLPQIIYPEIRVRVVDEGVPAPVMEERITRQLEEQLAITEDAIAVQSRTTEGRSAVDLSFAYGTDIDRALRDASTRLDRARRFLPTSIDPPIIFKRDPAQLPALELVVSSAGMDPVALRDWVDFRFSRWFLTLPGVAAVEVGGGLVREIRVRLDPARMEALGLTVAEVARAIEQASADRAAGELEVDGRELSMRTRGRLDSVTAIAALPIRVAGGEVVHLGDLAAVQDGHADESLRIRLDGVPGVKVSIQKQPMANTVEVVDAVRQRLAELHRQHLVPTGIQIHAVGDQSVYIRGAVANASQAAISGALLAMLVVYLFLGNLRRTLVIGSAIPIAVMVTFLLMDAAGLRLNIMTLGGLAVGVGLVVDNTIVMLENIYRHQGLGEGGREAARAAVREVHGPVVASTSTNLAAVLPFLFTGGLVGLLFRELIVTVSAAILASLVVALSLVPTLAARVQSRGRSLPGRQVDRLIGWLQAGVAGLLARLLRRRAWQLGLLALLAAGMFWALPVFAPERQEFLPRLDDGQVSVRITTDPESALEQTDALVRRIEDLVRADPDVVSVFTSSGGFVFGRSEYRSPNRASMRIQLRPRDRRSRDTATWMRDLRRELRALRIPGLRARVYTRGIRGIPLGRGDDDISLRIQGPELAVLERLGEGLADRLRRLPGLANVSYSAEERRQEIGVRLDRERLARFGLDEAAVAQALRAATSGAPAGELVEGERAHDIRVLLPVREGGSIEALRSVLVGYAPDDRSPVYLGDVGRVRLLSSPAQILRDNQQRIVEVSASLDGSRPRGQVLAEVARVARDMELPADYGIYDAGISRTLKQSESQARVLLGLALFLVFVVLGVQYESLRNPLIILFGVPFSLIGVAAGLKVTGLPISMPVWLGLIMLAGIVVNNAIVLVETIELRRRGGLETVAAICDAARLRLRPILMTSLTTIAGLLPLAMAWGEGGELLQPLAVTMIWGLGFSLLVSLALIPLLYGWIHASGTRLASR